MDKEFISNNRIKTFFSDYIGNFAGFVNQVLHDEEFLECIKELLPFDGVAYASMNVVPKKQVVKKMGVMVMRMDLEPSLYSLAVTIMIDWRNDGNLHEFSVFLTACKTIDELQEYVNEKKFMEEVIEQCSNRIICNKELLQKNASFDNKETK